MMNEPKIKDLLLNKIFEFKSTHVSKLSLVLDLSLNICFSYCEEINLDGYIEFIDVTTKDGKDAIVSINGKGEIFLKTGGYFKEEDDQTKEKLKENKRHKISNLSTYTAILTSIATVVLGVLASVQNNKINELENQFIVPENQEFKNELVGKWIEISFKGDTSMYQFNQDNSWEYTELDQNKKFIRKGEYQIGKEMGVFLRRYGSQHWFHDTTYRDIKSGIGTSYLFVRDSLLINNQEDYQHKFIKIK